MATNYRYRHEANYGSAQNCPGCGAPVGPCPMPATRDVEWPAEGYRYAPIAPAPASSYQGRPLSDDVLQDKVYDILQSDPRIPRDAVIAVEVHDRVATISGSVPDKWIKYIIGGDALSVPGIIDVENRIRISGRYRRPSSTEQGWA